MIEKTNESKRNFVNNNSTSRPIWTYKNTNEITIIIISFLNTLNSFFRFFSISIVDLSRKDHRIPLNIISSLIGAEIIEVKMKIPKIYWSRLTKYLLIDTAT